MDLDKRLIILLLSSSILFGACVSLKQPGKKIEFYTLEYDPPRKVRILEPFPLVISIELFSVAPIYNTNHIIYRDRSFKRNTYTYHQWKDNPGDMVTHLLSRDLKQSGMFKAVLSPESKAPFSHILKGTVDEFFEWNAEENCKAVLIISITLIAKNEKDSHKRILFQSTYSTSKPYKRKDPGAIAKAMSEAMKEVSGKIIEDFYHFLKDLY